MNKSELRNIIRKKRESLSKREVLEESKKIIELFINSEEYKKSKVIMSYMPIKNEVDTIDLNEKIIEDGKQLILPLIGENNTIIPCTVNSLNDLRKKGKYSIMEPDIIKEYLGDIDLVIVPGVAFDKAGNRIGFGKGYYDRFLSKQNSKRVSLGFHFQLVEKITTEKHDKKIEKIYTEGEIVYAK